MVVKVSEQINRQNNSISNEKIWGSVMVNVRVYGAKGDGVTDDTLALQRALDDSVNGTCFFPKGKGEYYLTGDLNIPSNTTVLFSTGVRLHGKTGTGRVINITQKTNVNIIGRNAVVSMNKAEYSSEFNHAISIYNSQNVFVEGVCFKDTGGDGIYIGGEGGSLPCENILIQNCITDNARRNGISVVHAIHVKIINCIMRNTIGTAPQFGIDVESNPDSTLYDITIENCTAHNNAMVGFGVGSGAKDVRFINCVAYQNVSHGFFVAKVGSLVPENVTIINCQAYSNVGSGIIVTDGKKISIDSCRSYLNTINGINLQGTFDSRIINSYSYENGGTGILSNLSTDAIIDNNDIYRNFSAGIIISTTSIRPVVRNNRCTDNANNSGAAIKVNLYVTNCSEPVITGNVIRMTVASAVSVTGMYVTANVINGYVKENDCFNGGTGSGIAIETAGGTINQGNRNKLGYYSTSENSNVGSIVWDPGSLADGTGETSAAITVTGANLGEFIIVAAPYDLQGITCTAYVSATNTVRIRLQNETGGTIDLASGTWRVRLIEF